MPHRSLVELHTISTRLYGTLHGLDIEGPVTDDVLRSIFSFVVVENCFTVCSGSVDGLKQ